MPVTPIRSLARGAATALLGNATSLARPLGFAVFARTAGGDALGSFLVIWTSVELGAKVATLGLDLGLRRGPRDDRAPAVAAALALAGVLSALIAAGLVAVLPRFVPIEAEALLVARVAVAVTLPLIALGNVALRAPHGTAQIASYVVARNVVEPLALLAVGLVTTALAAGTVPLLVAYGASIVAGALVAVRTLVRALGGPALVHAVRTPRAWPMRALVGAAVPLGLADLLQNAQTKLDLVIVALVTFSPAQIASYAIAAELVSALSNLRQGFDQVMAPIAAELRGQPAALADVLTTGMRWSAWIAVPLAAGLVWFAEPLLALFGGARAAAPVLIALVLGRAVEMIAGPAQSILAVVGRPSLALQGAAVGVTIALTLEATLALVWLGKLEHVRPRLTKASREDARVPAPSVLAVRPLS